jgi:hypothetical protein
LCLAVTRASILCDDLDEFSDENTEMHTDHMVDHTVAKRVCRKKSYDKTKIRRSDRLRIKKNNKKI